MRLDKELGVSYRQLSWWAQKGYIHESVSADGYARTFSDTEKMVARMMGRLVLVGFKPSAAAVLARMALETGSDEFDLGLGVELAFRPQNSSLAA